MIEELVAFVSTHPDAPKEVDWDLVEWDLVINDLYSRVERGETLSDRQETMLSIARKYRQ